MHGSEKSPAEKAQAEKLRQLSDRVELLSEFNQIIASGASMEKIAATISQQLAFRFSAPVVLVLVLSEDGQRFEIQASFGCPKGTVPESIEVHNSLMGRALRLGGLMTVPDLTVQSDHGLDFLTRSGVACLHTRSVESRTDTLGALVLGFKKERLLTDREVALLDEFARGAAATISNAKSQARLTAYAEKLEELVQRRTVDLERQKVSAEDANRAKSRFVANMSHELRTPLTAVIGYSSVLADGVFGEINEKQKEALQAISKSSEHLKDLIDEVLNLSRIEAGKEDPEPSKVELFSLLQQTYKLMLQTAVGKGITLAPLEVSESIKLLKLWVDPRHIRQVLINLMSNAVKYTPGGGTVKCVAEVIGDKVKISVHDNGVGISKDLIDRLFLRFERGDDQYSRTQVGTGIGLSLTKHLMEINGGRIGVESVEGQGSTFWVLVPLAEISAAETDVPNAEHRDEKWARLDGLNVLIVDDNELTVNVLSEIVRSCGGNPLPARSVKEARKLVETTHLDCSLIDLAIPGESGLALIEHLRRESGDENAQIPIIVVSACVFVEDQAIAEQQGATLFLPKPFKPQEIAQNIRNLTTAMFLAGGNRNQPQSGEGKG